jgi:uroporphyrinogen decarboxylase
MNGIERIRATLAGRPVDHPPFTLWYHFGTQCAPPELTARVHIEFCRAYGLDLLKVMNDYEYPMPKGLEAMTTPADLAKLTPMDVIRTPMAKQLMAIEMIAHELHGTALVVDTVFDPWNTLRRNLLKEALAPAMAECPEAIEKAIAVVNRNLIQYALACLDRGAAGIFYAVHASVEYATPDQYERFMRPYHHEFLEAIAGKGECHILHAHGENLHLEPLLKYPVHVLSWSDLNGGPSISEMRTKSAQTLMGGLDHKRFHALSATALREQAAAARRQAGNTKFILAPGCAVETWTLAPFVRAAREAARA